MNARHANSEPLGRACGSLVGESKTIMGLLFAKKIPIPMHWSARGITIGRRSFRFIVHFFSYFLFVHDCRLCSVRAIFVSFGIFVSFAIFISLHSDQENVKRTSNWRSFGILYALALIPKCKNFVKIEQKPCQNGNCKQKELWPMVVIGATYFRFFSQSIWCVSPFLMKRK